MVRRARGSACPGDGPPRNSRTARALESSCRWWCPSEPRLELPPGERHQRRESASSWAPSTTSTSTATASTSTGEQLERHAAVIAKAAPLPSLAAEPPRAPRRRRPRARPMARARRAPASTHADARRPRAPLELVDVGLQAPPRRAPLEPHVDEEPPTSTSTPGTARAPRAAPPARPRAPRTASHLEIGHHGEHLELVHEHLERRRRPRARARRAPRRARRSTSTTTTSSSYASTTGTLPVEAGGRRASGHPVRESGVPGRRARRPPCTRGRGRRGPRALIDGLPADGAIPACTPSSRCHARAGGAARARGTTRPGAGLSSRCCSRWWSSSSSSRSVPM